MTVPLWMLMPMALLAALKAAELSARWYPPNGKYSTILGPGGRVIVVENKSFWWVLTGRG